MADVGFNTVQSRTKGVKMIQGVIKVVGASNAANSSVTMEAGGDGISAVTRTGTGAYKLALRDQFVDFVGGHLSMMCSTAIDLVPQFVQQTADASGKDVTFKTLAAATATDTAAGVTHRILFTLFLKNTSAT